MAVDIGTDVTVAIAGVGAYNMASTLLSVSWSGFSRESIEMSHMLTTGGRDFIPADLYDAGEVTMEVLYDSTIAVPMDQVATVLTFSAPDDDTWACSAFCTGFEFTAPLEDRMTASITYKLTGDFTAGGIA